MGAWRPSRGRPSLAAAAVAIAVVMLAVRGCKIHSPSSRIQLLAPIFWPFLVWIWSFPSQLRSPTLQPRAMRISVPPSASSPTVLEQLVTTTIRPRLSRSQRLRRVHLQQPIVAGDVGPCRPSSPTPTPKQMQVGPSISTSVASVASVLLRPRWKELRSQAPVLSVPRKLLRSSRLAHAEARRGQRRLLARCDSASPWFTLELKNLTSLLKTSTVFVRDFVCQALRHPSRTPSSPFIYTSSALYINILRRRCSTTTVRWSHPNLPLSGGPSAASTSLASNPPAQCLMTLKQTIRRRLPFAYGFMDVSLYSYVYLVGFGNT
ncbi:hypothetical protein C2845_PM08G12290 [Panicum miliaceum]|uniref:Uncharacterized protein n=1 Tax=Panicum miliaceum TaxID=4540 RepID=A0A3L6R0X0_PANMI|nr:hypothetical protein C2845_PM08G12290 [Panicum miliaceum]